MVAQVEAAIGPVDLLVNNVRCPPSTLPCARISRRSAASLPADRTRPRAQSDDTVDSRSGVGREPEGLAGGDLRPFRGLPSCLGVGKGRSVLGHERLVPGGQT